MNSSAKEIKWHRFPFPTERLLWLLLLGSFLFIPAVLNPGVLAILRGYLLTLSGFFFIDFILTWGRPFQIRRKLPDRLILMRPYRCSLIFEKNRPYPLFIQVEDDVPPTFEYHDLPQSINLKHPITSISYHLKPLRRGQFPFRSVYVWVSGPLRLCYRPLRYPLRQSVTVYPDFQEAIRFYLQWKHPQQREGFRKVKHAGIGTEFHMLRLYEPGDDWRSIDWMATARLRQPHVRVYHQDIQKRVIVVLDASRTMGIRWQAKTRLDYGVAATANLVYLSLSMGDRVKIIVYDHMIRWESGWLNRQTPLDEWVRPLIHMNERPTEPNFFPIGSRIIQVLGSNPLIVWITSLTDPAIRPDFLSLLKILRRRSPIIMMNLQDPVVPQILRKSPEHPLDGFAKAYAARVIMSLDRMDESLRRIGIVAFRPDDKEAVRNLLRLFLSMRAGT